MSSTPTTTVVTTFQWKDVKKPKQRRELIKSLIEELGEDFTWAEAARRLGTPLTTLYSWVERYAPELRDEARLLRMKKMNVHLSLGGGDGNDDGDAGGQSRDLKAIIKALNDVLRVAFESLPASQKKRLSVLVKERFLGSLTDDQVKLFNEVIST